MSTVSKNFYRENFLISTNKAFIQLDALGAAFKSDVLWWAEAMSEEALRHMVNNSLCFGLYEVTPDPEKKAVHVIEGDNPELCDPKMVGFARLITDYVTFGYLSDVYVLPEHQGKGFGRWLLQCIDQELCQWPELRRVMLLCSSASSKFYTDTLGAEQWETSCDATNGTACMMKLGPRARKKSSKKGKTKLALTAEAEQINSHTN